MGKQTIMEWITDANTCFLIGTGCSVCANKPLMNKLTEQVVDKLDKLSKDLFKQLEGSNGREATVEDLLNQFLQMKRILSGRKDKKYGDWDIKKVEEAIRKTLQEIVKEIGCQWDCSETHGLFLQRLLQHKGRKICDVFSLNYDVVLEATLENLCIPYTDGFRGAENAYFDSNLFDMPSDIPLFRLYKIHGSINWVKDEKEIIRRKPSSPDNKVDERQVIYPCEQKYFLTQYGIYEVLMNLFRKRLRDRRPNNKLVIVGYSFADNHINEAIIDAICDTGNNLTVYAFVGEEKKPDDQIKRLEGLADRCSHKLNIMVGSKKFIGNALQESEWQEIQSENLWKFENLVKVMTEGSK
ncbi:MAG: SIR2 family protein [Syntrophaceae bacterium]|nr:SIR2 family protein [Syntrophaceae bacterium]